MNRRHFLRVVALGLAAGGAGWSGVCGSEAAPRAVAPRHRPHPAAVEVAA